MLTIFLIKVTYFYLIAFFLAILEIQIEGPYGWAEKLPAWRPNPESHLVKVYKKLMSEKEFTGYHFFLNIFLLLFLHWPFIWDWHWSIFEELEILGLYLMFVVVWDFLWFVLNPHFSLHDFGPAKVWWHKKWLGKFPVDYYFGIFGSVILFLPEIIKIDVMAGVYKVLILLGVNLILTIITLKVYPKAY